MYGKGSSNSYNHPVMTGFPRQFNTLSGTVTPYLASCYCPISQKVYFSPFYKNAFLEYDPVTGEQNEYFFDSSIAYPGANPASAQYSYSIMATPEGKVIAIPYFSPSLILLDTTTKEITIMTGFGVTGGIGKFYGGSVANDGFVYIHPYASTQFIKINVAQKSAVTFGESTSFESHLIGILGEDNCIYQVPYPYVSTNIRKMDLSTGLVTYLSVLPAAIYLGMTHTLDGRFCCIPYNTDSPVVIFNPVDQSIETIPFNSPTSVGTGIGFKPGANGNIYGFAGGRLFEIVISTKIINILNTERWEPGNVATQGCATTPQGIVYLSWNSTYNNKIVTIANTGLTYPEMFQFPTNIADIGSSPWNKFHQVL
jgi:hypothetical protein